MRRPIQPVVFAVSLVLSLSLASVPVVVANQHATPANGTPAATTTVVREVLVESEPATAPGELFQLVRYTIPAHLTLPAHTHPGIQMNTIEAGTLTYSVVAAGEIQVTRANGADETFGPGESTTFAVGDSFVEPAGIVHHGANLTSEPVRILTASLLAANEPPSTLADLATPATD
ncbi:MAG: cupin domain-containing protein [Chloroflexota bacterium]|nr:cupin domain-containing protein [Chloroflexota bacterium]